MNSFHIKLWACLFMLIDHIGYIMFPSIITYRIIGRGAFPLFSWLIAEGYIHTKDVKKYLVRLLIFATLYDIPFIIFPKLVLDVQKDVLNIFFTLFLGLIAIYLYDKENNKILKIIKIAVIAMLAQIIRSDYGFYGVITIFLFYYNKNDFKKMALSQSTLNIVYFIITPSIQIISLISLIFIYLYNNEQGKKIKWFFYLFYPVHLIFIYVLGIFFDS